MKRPEKRQRQFPSPSSSNNPNDGILITVSTTSTSSSSSDSELLLAGARLPPLNGSTTRLPLRFRLTEANRIRAAIRPNDRDDGATTATATITTAAASDDDEEWKDAVANRDLVVRAVACRFEEEDEEDGDIVVLEGPEWIEACLGSIGSGGEQGKQQQQQTKRPRVAAALRAEGVAKLLRLTSSDASSSSSDSASADDASASKAVVQIRAPVSLPLD